MPERQGGTDERVVLLLEAASWPLVQEERAEETEAAAAVVGWAVAAGRRRSRRAIVEGQLALACFGAEEKGKALVFSSSKGAAAWKQKGNNSGFGPACG